MNAISDGIMTARNGLRFPFRNCPPTQPRNYLRSNCGSLIVGFIVAPLQQLPLCGAWTSIVQNLLLGFGISPIHRWLSHFVIRILLNTTPAISILFKNWKIQYSRRSVESIAAAITTTGSLIRESSISDPRIIVP